MSRPDSPLGTILTDTARDITLAHVAGKPTGAAQAEGAARLAAHYQGHAPGQNGDRAGRLAWETEVKAALARQGIHFDPADTMLDLTGLYYAGLTVERAVAEIAGAKP